MNSQVVIGQEIPLIIKRIGINGEGIGYYKREAIFVKNALPSEECSVIIDEVYDGYAIGHVSRIKRESPNRIKPFCEYYGQCGGCQLQHISYDGSLVLKKELIINAIRKYTRLNPKSFEIRDTIGSKKTKCYRNKSSLPVCFDGKKTVLGIYEMETGKIIYVDNCMVQDERINKVNNDIIKLIDKHQIKSFNNKTKKGDIRYLVTRIATSGIQVTLVMYNEEIKLDNLALEICKIDGVASVYKCINKDLKSHLIFTSKFELLKGEKTITEKVGKIEIKLLPNAFYQLNSLQVEVLNETIKSIAKLDKKSNVLNIYSGVGDLAIWLSISVSKIYCIEDDVTNYKLSMENAKINNASNITFHLGEPSKIINQVINDKKIDALFVNPRRSGLEDLVPVLCKILPKKIVYTSCNLSSFAKDLNQLDDSYKIRVVQPIDLFPNSVNVEIIGLLEKK